MSFLQEPKRASLICTFHVEPDTLDIGALKDNLELIQRELQDKHEEIKSLSAPEYPVTFGLQMILANVIETLNYLGELIKSEAKISDHEGLAIHRLSQLNREMGEGRDYTGLIKVLGNKDQLVKLQDLARTVIQTCLAIFGDRLEDWLTDPKPCSPEAIKTISDNRELLVSIDESKILASW